MIDDVLDRSAALRAYAEYERAGRYWKAALGNRPLRQIVAGDVERYKSKRIKEVAAATVNRELMFLKRVFNLALSDGKAERNPVREVKFSRTTTPVPLRVAPPAPALLVRLRGRREAEHRCHDRETFKNREVASRTETNPLADRPTGGTVRERPRWGVTFIPQGG